MAKQYKVTDISNLEGDFGGDPSKKHATLDKGYSTYVKELRTAKKNINDSWKDIKSKLLTFSRRNDTGTEFVRMSKKARDDAETARYELAAVLKQVDDALTDAYRENQDFYISKIKVMAEKLNIDLDNTDNDVARDTNSYSG